MGTITLVCPSQPLAPLPRPPTAELSPSRKGSAGSSQLPSNPMADLDANEMLHSSHSLRRWPSKPGDPAARDRPIPHRL